MADKKFFVDVNLQGNNINNLRADTLDITSNLASANTKRIVYWSGQYYYSNGTTWIALSGGGSSLPTGGATGDILAKASGTDYDVEWISNYTSTVQHEVKAGVALTKGQAVYVSSADGTNMIVSKASNASEATSSKTMGLAASSAALNGFIFVITEGLLTGTGGAPLDTSTANAGDPVWLGTNGNLIFGLANKPVAPAHLVFLGIVTRSSANVGEIFVKIQNGFELGELHNVDALNASNNDGLFYNTSNSLWEHKSIATALGYTPENVANKSTSTSLGTSDTLYPTQNAVKVYADSLLGDANALVYKGTIDCSTNPDYPAADAGWMYIASVAGKIGGASGTDVEVGDMIICNTDGTVSGNQATVGQYWNVIQKNIVGAVTGPASSVSDNVVFFDGTTGKIIKDSGLTLSGSNTGDETTATIKTKLGIATTSADGYLTSTNWTTFNNKIGGSGTANYLSKFTASGTIGNSLIQDNGTTAAIGAAPTVNSMFSVTGNAGALFGISGRSIKANGYGGDFLGVNGVKGTGTGSGGLGSATGGEFYAYDNALNIGVYGVAGIDSYGATTNIGGKFIALDATNNYAVQLVDGTEGLGKFLKCVDGTFGYANWASLVISDVASLQTSLDSKSPLTPRVQTVASSATVTPVSTNDLVIITAQAAGLTLANPTGTFVEGQALMIRIKDNGTARTIAFGNNYRAIGITLPTTTVISKTMYLGIIYNSTDGKWDVLGLNQQS